MLEPLVRKHLNHFQRAYECFPSPARHLLTSARGWLLTRIRYSPKTLETLRVLRSHEHWSSEEIAEHQLASLRQMLAHARRTVPFYRDYPDISLNDPNDLRKLPILTRETVRADSPRLLSAAFSARQRIQAGTTGTTGANLLVGYREEALAENWAFLLRQWAWAGIAPRSPRLTLFGARVAPSSRSKPPYWAFNVPERQLLLSIFHLSEKTAPAYLDCLRRHSGKVLEGFPSVLSILADFALERGETLPMRAVFTSGEPLYPAARARIEQAFQTRVFDSYGMTELCGLVQECERGEMHLAPDYGYLEILDENNQPVAAGEEGYFVWTGFFNRAMPLIRYRIGDRGMWRTGPLCACGRAFPRVAPTITRESDILRVPDGRVFSPRALNQLLKEATALRFCQFIHDRRNRVVVRGVSCGARGGADLVAIRAALQRLLGPSVQVSTELCAAPIARKGGKIPLIVNQVAQ